MKTSQKRLLSLLLALVLLCGVLAVPAAAATEQSEAAANELYRLGLFKGSGTLSNGMPDFDLDGTATRAQAAVMLVRLLGGEEEALSQHYKHPFTDAGWASSYVGYAYEKGIVNGRTATTFDANGRVSASDFLTMLLRALGYTEVDWADPYPTARSVGLAWSGVNDFRRGDMAYICQSALSCKADGSSQTLLQSLEDQGAIHPTELPEPPSFTPGPVTPTAPERYTVSSCEDAVSKLRNAINCRTETIVLTGPVSLMDSCVQAVMETCRLCSDITNSRINTNYDPPTMVITVTPHYTDAVEIMAYLEGKRSGLSQANAQTLARAQQVHAAIVTPELSEYDQVKAFHDWMVNNITFGGASDRRFTAGGALVDGAAVCDGYAMAFDLLCYLSGIDCVRVTGYANEAHAWNKVKVDGNWYNIDVTWDDSGSVLIYDYFLISDAAIARDHVQDENPYWPAAPANWSGRR